MNSLNFCLEMYLSLLHSWTIVLLAIEFLVDSPLSFRILNMSSYPPSVFQGFYNEKSVVNFIEDPVMTNCFSFAAFKILSLGFNNLTILCLNVDLRVYPALRLDVYFMSSSDLQSFPPLLLQILFLLLSSSCYWDSYGSYIGTYNDLPPFYWALFILLLFFPPASQFESFQWSYLQVHWSFCLLKSIVESL